MSRAIEELGATEVIARLERFEEHVVRGITRGDQEFREPHALLLAHGNAEGSLRGGRRRLLRHRAARGFPLPPARLSAVALRHKDKERAR